MARWDTLRKVARNRVLREYYLNHGDLSYRELGEVFGISRQRAFRLIKEEIKKLSKITNPS